MAVPKIDRESGLFEKNVCDKINKKVQLLQDNINELEVPPLNPFYKVEKISNFIDTPKISSGYIDEESNPYFYYADVSITEDNSSIIDVFEAFPQGVTFFKLFPRAPNTDIDLPFPGRLTDGTSIFLFPDKYCPVKDSGLSITSCGVPRATIFPPFIPAPLPISTKYLF